MRLSEAIRLGAMWHPQHRGGYMTIGDVSVHGDILGLRVGVTATCAMAAAIDAAGCRIVVSQTSSHDIAFRGERAPVGAVTRTIVAPHDWREVLQAAVPCPVCAEIKGVPVLIAHLNDDHAWTREAIADWVDTVDPLPVIASPPTEDAVSVTPE